MNKYAIIQYIDTEYYEDNFNYAPIIVKKDKDFNEKIKKLQEVSDNYYSDYEEQDIGICEVLDKFIEDNFEVLSYDTIEEIRV